MDALLRHDERSGRYPALGRPRTALQPVGNRVVFLDLFYGLREEGAGCRREWQGFLTALDQGLHGSSLLRFYHLGRACLVKSETYFDAYDRVFARVFKGVEGALGDDVTEKVLEWLRDPKNLPELTPEQLAALEQLSSDELMRRFLETLASRPNDTTAAIAGSAPRPVTLWPRRRDPTGVRVGGRPRAPAMKVAEERRFRGYRTDACSNVQQLRVALRRLRQLTRADRRRSST